MKRRWFIFAFAMMLAVCFAGCNDQYESSSGQVSETQYPIQGTLSKPESSQEPEESVESEEPVESVEYGIGEPGEINGVTATLTNIEEVPGNELNEPDDDKVLLLCYFDIENGSDEYVPMSDNLSFEAYVDDYVTHTFSSATLYSSSGAGCLYGGLDPGRKMAGVVGYEVDKDWSVLEIIFRPDIHKDGEITFRKEKN